MRCLVLFSGSLESMLAARLMQLQEVEPIGLFFTTLCARSQPPTKQADQLGMRLVMSGVDEGYYHALRHPTLGRTKNAAACLDCRVQLLRQVREMQQAEHLRMEIDSAFLVSGEVLGQRPRSQNRNDLEAVAYHADVEELLVRPLSAKLLPETRPEREKWIDREQLHAFHGNAHKGLIQLARELGLGDLPASRPACGLTDTALSARVFDHLEHSTSDQPAEFNLLTIGRHFRFDAHTKVVVGRNQDDNRYFSRAFGQDQHSAVVKPANFVGPTALVLGPQTTASAQFAASLVMRFSKQPVDSPLFDFIHENCSSTFEPGPEQNVTARAIGAS
jgi:tRNA-uridine 2-sulfurtransferase